jgi:hypothetical protein
LWAGSCRTWLSSLGPVRAPATIPAGGHPSDPRAARGGQTEDPCPSSRDGFLDRSCSLWSGGETAREACNDAGQRDRQDRWTTHQSDRIPTRDGFSGRQMPHPTPRQPAFPLVRAYVEPPAGIEPATPPLPWNHQEPLCEPPSSQVTLDRRCRSYRFSLGEVMRSLSGYAADEPVHHRRRPQRPAPAQPRPPAKERITKTDPSATEGRAPPTGAGRPPPRSAPARSWSWSPARGRS